MAESATIDTLKAFLLREDADKLGEKTSSPVLSYREVLDTI